MRVSVFTYHMDHIWSDRKIVYWQETCLFVLSNILFDRRNEMTSYDLAQPHDLQYQLFEQVEVSNEQNLAAKIRTDGREVKMKNRVRIGWPDFHDSWTGDLEVAGGLGLEDRRLDLRLQINKKKINTITKKGSTTTLKIYSESRYVIGIIRCE